MGQCCCCCYYIPRHQALSETDSFATLTSSTGSNTQKNPLSDTKKSERVWFWVSKADTTEDKKAPPTSESGESTTSQEDAVPAITLTHSPNISPLMDRRRSSFVTPQFPLGTLRPELYPSDDVKSDGKRSKSFSGGSIDEFTETYGSMTFAIRYSKASHRMVVHLQQVSDLPAKGHGDTAYDTVVSACILPDEKFTSESSVVHKTLSPQYDEEIDFPLDMKKSLEKQALRMSVYDAVRRHKYNVVGHVIVPFTQCDFGGHPKTFKKAIKKRSMITQHLGRLMLTLAYLPSNERLSVVILRANGLQGKEKESKELQSLETYVKVSLMVGENKVKSRHTNVSTGASPIFTESLTFVVPSEYISDACLVIQVLQKGHFKRDDTIGRLILGPYMYTDGRNLSHWGRMVSHREATKKWHDLYL
ncbi:synaptotagmin-15-like isoform X2 [Anneissia japonica]|nr:synaptotagmin-15-like isoform X2 [Anneissia japonica]XP_033108359.1 synaptotagmin-15-like isoform X2 [Anneissia japonica]XP_033108360.1 synaptotagmin-15-like isoform X2 [Anneissia japonica]XP_033108361.1 synaptotagmin-15-like isoform X2 [Anneissia japonica]